jgi:SAM-dependent methyltransferase
MIRIKRSIGARIKILSDSIADPRKIRIAPPIWDSAHGKRTFLESLKKNSTILDVGCGNNSPFYTKTLCPSCYYIGIDVGDHHQAGDPKTIADEYIIVISELFAEAIESMSGRADIVISAHNLEHCEEPKRVLTAMARALKPGGRLYLSFPCEASVSFPKRRGSLNFFDDATHRVPPDWRTCLQTLSDEGCKFTFKAPRYRPWRQFLQGMLRERESKEANKVESDGSTWAYYGFESIIWAYKP